MYCNLILLINRINIFRKGFNTTKYKKLIYNKMHNRVCKIIQMHFKEEVSHFYLHVCSRCYIKLAIIIYSNGYFFSAKKDLTFIKSNSSGICGDCIERIR